MSLPSGIFQESYGQDMAILRTKLQWIILLAFLALLFTMPLYTGDHVLTLATMIGISIISVLGLNILTGYCGQISMGHAGFMAVGGYVSAILAARYGWPFWAALPCAGLAAGLVGIIFGLPSLKIKGFYLIMATVAAQFIVIWLILQFREVTGGTDGIAVPRPSLFGYIIQSKGAYFILVMIIACLATYFAKNLARTRVGRAFVAIRDNDLAAEVMGINLLSYKLLAFFIGCVYAGIAGSLLVHYFAFADINMFTFGDSVWYLAMLIVGGMGSTSGAILGAVALKLLDEAMTIGGPALAAAFPAIAAQAAASLSMIMRGLIIIIFLIFEPRGLMHRWEMVKTYFRRWPFSV